MCARFMMPGVFLASALTAPSQILMRDLGRLDHLPATQEATLDVVAVDLDGDTAVDLALLSDAGLRVFLGDGRGAFAERAASQIAMPPGTGGGLVAGDVDGDGDADLLYHKWIVNQNTSARLLLNDGNAAFADASARLPSTTRVTCLLLGDVDGDGDLDLFVGGGTGGSAGAGQSNRLLLNDGKGSFSEPPGFPTDTDNTTSAALLDVDGDGKLDLIAGNSATYLGPVDQDKLYRGDGKGGFTLATGLPADRVAAAEIAAGDIDRDGDVDYAVANRSAGLQGGVTVHLYRNDGTGVFAEHSVTAETAFASAVSMVDADGDGSLDLVTGRLGPAGRSGGLRVFFGDGRGGFQPGGTGFGDDLPFTVSVAAFDCDRDGHLDLLAANSLQRNRLYLGAGQRRWLDATGPRSFGLPYDAIRQPKFTLVDVDRDGDLDLVEIDAPLRLSLGDGDDVFTNVTATHLPALTGRALDFLVHDFDRDGHPDLVVAIEVQTTWSLRLLAGSASGRFTAAPPQDLPFTQYVLSLAAGDLDGNGTQDLVVGGYGGPFLFLGDGQGRFTADTRSTFQTELGLNPQRLGDVDGDGDLDLVVKTQNHLPSDQLQVYANDGSGVFAYLRSIRFPIAMVDEFHLVDTDVDGDLDVVIVARQVSFLFLNDGHANFADVTSSHFPVTTPASTVQRHAFADWDGDRDPDLILIWRQGELAWLRYLENVGGRYQDRSHQRLGAAVTTFPTILWHAVVDHDGDGDPDLALAETSGKRVLANLLRHAHVPLALRLGRGTAVDLFSRPGMAAESQLALLQLGAAAARYRVEPFGWLRVDLASLVLLPPVALPAPSGVLRLPLFVPSDAGLLGLRLHAQSLVIGGITNPISGWRYSNLAIAPPLTR